MPMSDATPAKKIDWKALAPRIAVTLLAAPILSLLSAPANLYWLHWIAYLPMFWVLREETPRANRWFAFLYGTVAVAVIFRWIVATITLFSNIPAPLAWGILVLFSMAFGLPYFFLWAAVHPLRKRLGDAWIVVLPAWLVVVEWIGMHVILFPYNQGITQFGFLPLWQVASVTGVWGLSYLVLFFNAAVAETIYRDREGRPPPLRWVAAAVATVSILTIWGVVRHDRIERKLAAAPVMRVGMIQTSKTMTHRFSESRKRALYDWVDETKALIAVTEPGDVDLVVWSEGSSPYNVHEGKVLEIIGDLAKAGGFEMFVGGGTVNRLAVDGKEEVEAYNSVYLFGADGAILGRYDKVVPLPFGEYLPLAHVFPWLADLIQGPGDFRAGQFPNVLVGKHRLATPICYEAILPGLCRRYEHPELFLNPTNDAWFGDTSAPWQHGMLAASRSVELGLPLVRSGYTGASFVVEPHGRIHSVMPPFVRGNQVVRVRMLDVPTVYRRFGDWFVGVCALGLLAAWAVTRKAAAEATR